jgi:hypothetical protein
MSFSRSLKGKAECDPNREFNGEWKGEILFALELDGETVCLMCSSAISLKI